MLLGYIIGYKMKPSDKWKFRVKEDDSPFKSKAEALAYIRNRCKFKDSPVQVTLTPVHDMTCSMYLTNIEKEIKDVEDEQ